MSHIIGSFKNLLLCLIIAFYISGCQSKQKCDGDQFVGRWVASYFIDNLSLGNINTIPFGVTEMSIPENFVGDGVTFWNEDVEEASISQVTCHADTLALFFDNKEYGRILFRGGQLGLVYHHSWKDTLLYNKIDSSLVDKAANLDVTVVGLLVNRVMSQPTFIDEGTQNIVQFEESGQISGLNDFVHYQISIAGDEANIDSCVSISFFDSKGKITKWGMKGSSKEVELYTLRLLTELGEKPWYEADKLTCRLLVK